MEYRFCKEEVRKEKIKNKEPLRENMITKRKKISPILQKHQQSELTLEEAAHNAKVSIWKMMDYITAKNITPPAQNLAELKQQLEHAKKIFK